MSISDNGEKQTTATGVAPNTVGTGQVIDSSLTGDDIAPASIPLGDLDTDVATQSELEAHTLAVAAAHAATAIANTPAGDISATTVQGALDELDAEKLASAGDTMSGTLDMDGNYIDMNGGSILDGSTVQAAMLTVLANGMANFGSGTIATAKIFAAGLAADANYRFHADRNGRMDWGDGTSPLDVRLERTAANTLALGAGDTLQVQQDPVVDNDVVRKAYADDIADAAINDGDAAGGDLAGTFPNPTVVDDSHNHTLSTITDAGTMAAEDADDYVEISGDVLTGTLGIEQALGTAIAFYAKVTGNAENRFQVREDGRISFGGGTVAPDAYIEWAGTAALSTNAFLVTTSMFQAAGGFENTGDGPFHAGFGSVAISEALRASAITDPYVRFSLRRNGVMNLGDGTAVYDTSIGRQGAGEWGGDATTQLVSLVAAPTQDEHLTRKDYVDDAIAAIVFGDFFQLEEQNTQLDTTSGTYAEFMTLDTASLSAGTYRVEWRFDWQASNNATNGQYRVQVDDTTTLDEVIFAPSASNCLRSHNNFVEVVLGAGTHSIDIDIRRAAGGGTFTIDTGRIDIFRVA